MTFQAPADAARAVGEKLFFFHNPKAGGMSVAHAIRSSLPDATVSPTIENDLADHERLGGEYARFRGFDVYSGHYGRDVFEATAAGHHHCSNFRHPVARVVSLYNFFRAYPISSDAFGPSHYIPLQTAKSRSFVEFVAHSSDEVQCYVSNTHFRQLTSSAYELGIKASLASALSFVEGMLFVFVAELPELSAQVMRTTTPITAAIPRINATSGSGRIDWRTLEPAVYREVMARNELDLAVYDHAVHLLRRRAATCLIPTNAVG